ncbi:3147_t:CDS:1, partial [Racocetra fulgida]
NLKDVLQLPEEQPYISQIEGAIRELRYSIKELKGSTEYSFAKIEERFRTSLTSLTRIEEAIKAEKN